jgi:hypothetical protein
MDHETEQLASEFLEAVGEHANGGADSWSPNSI